MTIHDYIFAFIPVFFIMVLVEYFYGKRKGRSLYSRSETVNSIVIAVGQRLVSLLPLGPILIIARFAYENAIFSFNTDAWWYVFALFVCVEFFYYWFHRFSHTVRWLWATHAVHHSIREMNILGSYRLGWTGKLSGGALLYTPLYVFGFNPTHVVLMLALILIYQSWLHTTLIGKLGPLEGIINTPSAHRVHHARNPEYLDKNFGGVLMIFDNVFQTYASERDSAPVVFGLVNEPSSNHPIGIAFHEWARMVSDLKTQRLNRWPVILFGKPNGHMPAKHPVSE